MNYGAIIEAILFTMGDSVELSKLAEVLELEKDETRAEIEKLKSKYEAENRGITITELDGGLIALTRFSGDIGFYPEEYAEIFEQYVTGL